MGSLIADVVLLLIMLVGLLRLPFGEGSGYSLERLLWKQVCLLRFSLWGSKFTISFYFFRKGLIWLLLALICEIPSTVRLSVLLSSSFSLISIS